MKAILTFYTHLVNFQVSIFEDDDDNDYYLGDFCEDLAESFKLDKACDYGNTLKAPIKYVYNAYLVILLVMFFLACLLFYVVNITTYFVAVVGVALFLAVYIPIGLPIFTLSPWLLLLAPAYYAALFYASKLIWKDKEDDDKAV